MKKIFNQTCGVLLAIISCTYIHSTQAQTLASTENYDRNGSTAQYAKQVKTLKNVLSELETAYKVSFIYKSELIGIQIDNYDNKSFATLEEALEELLKPRGLSFRKVRDNFFIVLKNDQSGKLIRKINRFQESASEASFSNNLLISRINQLGLITTQIAAVDVSGKVTGEDGTGLPGVNVTVKGTTTGTVTDATGTYRLTVPDNATLVFSYIGYVTEEVAVGTRTTVDIRLVPDIKSLN
jgi:hypothetical protein